MRRILLTLALVAALLTGGAPAAHAQTPGALFLIGGALSDDNAAIYGEFVRQAGGAQARIGVLSASSAVPHSSANAAIKALKRHGAGEAVWIPVTEKKKGSGEDPANAALAAGMTAFFLTGGDQFRYVQTMIRPDGTDGAVLSVVRQRFAAGAPIAGTSAGMQILAGPDMVTGGLSYYGWRDGAQPGYFDTDEILGYWPAGGFGFFTAGLLDTHFDARGRHGRSIRLAMDTGHDRVFGVGEDTALIVNGPIMRVVGVNGVSILDLSAGMNWSYLVHGDGYHADSRAISKTDPLLVPDERTTNPPTTDVFGPYELLTAALDLSGAGLSPSITGTTAETAPQFAVTLTKGPGFVPYTRSFTGLTITI